MNVVYPLFVSVLNSCFLCYDIITIHVVNLLLEKIFFILELIQVLNIYFLIFERLFERVVGLAFKVSFNPYAKDVQINELHKINNF